MNLDEQQIKIIHAIQDLKNISINAVFGSGKTTTILQTIKALPNKSAILITYNTHLKNEVQEKIEHQNLNNIQVYTYHSLCMKYFGYGKNDEEIQIYHQQPPKHILPKIDILFIDEIQDMTLLLYTFIQKFIYYLSSPPQLVICGDHLQGVYQFKGADKRFLTLGSQIYQTTLESFEMSTSYRLTNSMGWFINECIYGKKILHTIKEGPSILFFNQTVYRAVYGIIERLNQYLAMGYKAEDIFILSPSLKGSQNSPLKILENLIYDKLRLPVYYSTQEDRELNDKVIQNKVVFSTFHQSKGRERKIVVVFGVDESYFDFYAKDEDRKECPSTLIVALSRSKEVLMIVKDVERKPLPFMKMRIMEMRNSKHVQVIGSICEYETSKSRNLPLESYRKISVTDLVKYIKPDIQSLMIGYKEQLFEKKSEVVDNVEIDPFVINKFDTFEICEDVSDMIGMLLPAIFEEQQTGTSSIKEKLLEYEEKKISSFMREKLNKVNYESTDIKDLLYMIKVYKSLQVGIYSPFQIEQDQWLTSIQIDRILKNMEVHIKDKQLYEYEFHDDKKFKYYHHEIFGKICITGRLDCLDKNHVWEFKCVKELTLEHFLQVICYQWLWNFCLREQFECRTFRLLNIRTGEMYELKKNEELVHKVIDLLIQNRYEKMISISDEEFVKTCLDVKQT